MTPSTSAAAAEQTMREKTKRRIPPEIVDEILLNLPVKSLLRFSSVSKPWNSAIFGSGFGERYRGRERIVLESGGGSFYRTASTCLVSSIIPVSNITAAATDFDAPFGYKVEASCRELWLARAAESLFLWNPSMRTYKELPESPLKPEGAIDFVFGLGFERIGGDCKILQIRRKPSRYKAAVYSLKSNSWKCIKSKKYMSTDRSCGVFVSGRLHWMPDTFPPNPTAIVSFDLSTEKFGKAEMPYSPVIWRTARLSVLRGKLSVSMCYEEYCEVWMMEEYGVDKSWAKKFRIERSSFGLDPILPLYLFENGEILVRAGDDRAWKRRTFVYRDDETKPEEVKIGSSIGKAFLYVDSLVMVN